MTAPSNYRYSVYMPHTLIANTKNRTNVIIAATVAFMIIAVGVTLVVSKASGFFAANEPELGTLAGNASQVTIAGASGGKALQFNAPATPPPPPPPSGPQAIKIMPLGDSITQGGVGGDPNTINGYRLQLWNDLKSDYTIDYVGTWQNGNSQLPDKDLNGFSGNCIMINPCNGDPSLYSRTANWVSTENPDLVIMQGGGNDFSDPSTTETKVETYMESWIQLVFATKPSVKIIVAGPPQWYPGYDTALANYVSAQRAAGKPIRYISIATYGTVDGTHPSVAGYADWGDALATKVRELFP